MLEASVAAVPDKPAIITVDDQVTYRELLDEVRGLAGRLAAIGVGAGDRVGLLSGSGIAFTVAAWATWELGATLVPLNFRLTATDLAAQVEDSCPAVVLVGRTRADLGTALADLVSAPVRIQADGDRQFLADVEAVAYERPDISGQTPAAILYTSGTTGRPKGVVIAHGNAVQNSITCTSVIGRVRDDIELVMAPQFNVTGLCSETVPAIHAGMTMVLLDAFDAAGAVRVIREHSVTSTVGAPTMWWRLLDAAGADGLPTLRLALYGGAPMPRALQERMREALPGAAFGNGYGMTETTSMVCYLGGQDALDRPESVGPPLPLTELRIVDPESGMDVPAGEVGEVVVRGSQVAIGYWTGDGVRSLTDADGWLRTGDGARLVDGFLVLADRLKDVIKRAGESVFSIEVEEVLYQHPDVMEASVTGVPDPTMGERVLAVVVPKPGCDPDADAIRDHCRAHLAGFKVPSFVMFRDELPRNAGGKVVKGTLKEEFAARPLASDPQ
jgi:acyl-CoA synthetase (AMP-forming)/AMP-acid ligase II